jgi:hypothetical protein
MSVSASAQMGVRFHRLHYVIHSSQYLSNACSYNYIHNFILHIIWSRVSSQSIIIHTMSHINSITGRSSTQLPFLALSAVHFAPHTTCSPHTSSSHPAQRTGPQYPPPSSSPPHLGAAPLASSPHTPLPQHPPHHPHAVTPNHAAARLFHMLSASISRYSRH